MKEDKDIYDQINHAHLYENILISAKLVRARGQEIAKAFDRKKLSLIMSKIDFLIVRVLGKKVIRI